MRPLGEVSKGMIMRSRIIGGEITRRVLLAVTIVGVACSGGDTPIDPIPSGDILQLTAAHIASLDSSAQAISHANPGNPDLQSLVDSTLLVLTAGIDAKRIDVSTNLTTSPLYFVGIHRSVSRAQGSFSTWTLVALDNPSHLASLIEVSGFAEHSGSTAPTSVSGTIGDGTGSVNALMLQVGTGGAVTSWYAASGTASFSSGPAGAACPGFTPTPVVTCALEMMRVRFTAVAPSGTGGIGGRQAAVITDVDVPTMRLTYSPP
jgi:hypothetical protein